MRRISCHLALILVFAATLLAAPRNRVVFEVSVGSESSHQNILTNISNLLDALPDTEVEVVVHGKGIGLLLKDNPALRDRLEKLAKAGVKFAACQNTLRARNLKKDDLVSFATVVDSGVAEVVRQQQLGWAYIKAGE